MALIVQKFGGTSVGTTERIKSVAGRISAFKAAGHQLVVVVSAMSGETNRLIALAKEVQAEPDPREYDVVVSTGEQVTIGLLCMALLERGGSDTTAVALAAALKADECQIYTDVDGVYTTDPRIVPEARRLKSVTFEEMLEMASLGSKVLQIP